MPVCLVPVNYHENFMSRSRKSYGIVTCGMILYNIIKTDKVRVDGGCIQFTLCLPPVPILQKERHSLTAGDLESEYQLK